MKKWRLVVIHSDGSTYDTDLEDCTVAILNSDGIRELDDTGDAKCLDEEHFVSSMSAYDMAVDAGLVELAEEYAEEDDEEDDE
jgi:hypothetical protein